MDKFLIFQHELAVYYCEEKAFKFIVVMTRECHIFIFQQQKDKHDYSEKSVWIRDVNFELFFLKILF